MKQRSALKGSQRPIKEIYDPILPPTMHIRWQWRILLCVSAGMLLKFSKNTQDTALETRANLENSGKAELFWVLNATPP